MIVTNEILHDALHCLYKAYKKINRESLTEKETDFTTLNSRLRSEYKEEFQNNFSNPTNKFSNRISVKRVRSNKISLDQNFRNERIDLTFDALEVRKNKIVPILMIPSEKVGRNDKLFIAAQGILAAQEFSVNIENCKVIFGESFRHVKFRILPFRKKLDTVLVNLRNLSVDSSPPDFFRNSHCLICEFQPGCLEKLRERDDLSLLTGLKRHEIAAINSRGIFTVKQLSFTFRPKKNPYRIKRFLPELKALAIREGKTFIHEQLIVPRSDVEVFLDIEGLPDNNFHYLIGVIIRTRNSEVNYSFWANDRNEEIQIFRDLIDLLNHHPESVIYHYGSYEQQAIKGISKRIPDHQASINKILANCFNVLSVFSRSIYPPTYTNGLKEVARFLNFDWTEKDAGGLQSIIWRHNWRLSKERSIKEKLLQYNLEDCQALMKVFDWICKLSQPNDNTQLTSTVKQKNIYKWGVTDYAIEDFEEINSRSYFNYQRDHIFFRKSKKTATTKISRSSPSKRFNKPRRKINLFPIKCAKCKSQDLMILYTAEKLQLDLTFLKNGIKSTAVVYSGGPYFCRKCKKKYFAENMRRLPKYGLNLMIWAVNQKIQYQLSSESVINVLKDSLGIEVSPTQMTRFKGVVANMYRGTYNEIMKELVNSQVIHVDETIARIKGIDGYVWVFANHAGVYYEFRETRETDFLKESLKIFKGTLISDFYTGYDSIECKQQKCLVHLIRDMNGDFLKNQFDVEFKTIIIEFGKLLRKIIATVDRYGLREIHLHKHLRDVERFYSQFINKNFQSDLAQAYKKRLVKYKVKMFQFLEEDDVPWNNNNAEHSIKPFAKWRKRKTSNLTVPNIQNHLILLSILQTCKYRGLSFFEFLKSGKMSIFHI
jgi:predicted RecB family nuclease